MTTFRERRRARMMALRRDGIPADRICYLMCITPTTLKNLLRRDHEDFSGGVAPRERGAFGERRRACIAEYVADGLTTAEIASVMGVSEQTVFNDLRALQAAAS